MLRFSQKKPIEFDDGLHWVTSCMSCDMYNSRCSAGFNAQATKPCGVGCDAAGGVRSLLALGGCCADAQFVDAPWLMRSLYRMSMM